MRMRIHNTTAAIFQHGIALNLAPRAWMSVFVLFLIATVGWSQTTSSSGYGTTTGGSSMKNENRRDKSKSKKNRKDDRRSSSRRKKKDEGPKVREAKTAAGQPSRARAQGRTGVARQRKPSKARSSGGGAKSIPLPGFSMKSDLQDDAIYFDPIRQDVLPGDRFTSKLIYYNSRDHRVDEVELWVQYNPEIVDPQWVDIQPIERHTSETLTLRQWRDQGFIQIGGRLTKPMDDIVNDLATIHWVALTSSPRTRIELAAPPGTQVALMEDGKNVIETTGVGNTGRVAMDVRIVPDDAEGIRGMRLIDQTREAMTPLMDPMTRVRLAIVPPEPFAGTDEVATADIVLINPSDEPFDELQFRIRYDPTAVKILDADVDNYIAAGVNIFDGDFHRTFPFDYHVRNEVDPRRGVIAYHVGSTSGPVTYSGGTVARIVYRMLRQAGNTVFWFDRADPLTGGIATDVSSRGRSLLGDTDDDARQALHGARVTVRPLVAGQL